MQAVPRAAGSSRTRGKGQGARGRRRAAPGPSTLDSRPAVRLRRPCTRALLTGLLSNVALKKDEKNEYLGSNAQTLFLWPGSGLVEKKPKWVVAAELVETTRRYARTLARINPAWIEPLAGHLVKKTHNEPRWDAASGRVVADERVTLYGLPVIPRRVGELRPDRPRRRPHAVPAGWPRRRGLGEPAGLVPQEPGASRGDRRDAVEDPPHRPAAGGRRPLRLLRRPAVAGGVRRPDGRPLAEGRRSRRPSGRCCSSKSDLMRDEADAREGGRLPRGDRGRRHAAAARLPPGTRQPPRTA